jgi:protoheme IX farnesyltransferase
METLRLYLSLTKPGVLFGNALTAAAGFLLAARGNPDPVLFLSLVIGSTLVIAAACVLNNYFDQDIDALMARTKTRAVPAGKVPGRNAVIFGIILAVVGFAILYQYTSILVVLLGLIGFVDYLYFYAMLGKRRSMHGTLIGSISGAIPVTAGYVAVTGTIDIGAIIVFLILFFWQMPEFYSIAIYRHDEYKAAGVPVISVVKGVQETRRQIFIYTILFSIATMLLYTFGYVGIIYLIVMGLLDLYWIWLAVQGFSAPDLNIWARKMFRFSLIVLLVFSALISLTGILP